MQRRACSNFIILKELRSECFDKAERRVPGGFGRLVKICGLVNGCMCGLVECGADFLRFVLRIFRSIAVSIDNFSVGIFFVE